MNTGPFSAEKPLHAFKPDKSWAFQLVKNLVRPRHSFRAEAARKSRDFFLASPPDLNSLFHEQSTSLFVWIPKTAGTSIYRWVESQSNVLLVKEARDLPQLGESSERRGTVAFGSMNIDDLVEARYLNPLVLQSRYSFAFVRNPYARIASLYRYGLKMGALPKKTPFRVFLWLVARQEPVPGLYNWAGLSMASPMVNWIRQESWSGPKEVLRLEDGDAAFTQIGKKLGLRGMPGRENETSASVAPVEYHRFEIDLIQDIFFEDFTEFGYSLEPPK